MAWPGSSASAGGVSIARCQQCAGSIRRKPSATLRGFCPGRASPRQRSVPHDGADRRRGPFVASPTQDTARTVKAVQPKRIDKQHLHQSGEHGVVPRPAAPGLFNRQLDRDAQTWLAQAGDGSSKTSNPTLGDARAQSLTSLRTSASPSWSPRRKTFGRISTGRLPSRAGLVLN